jgi:transcription elongation factor GreA
MNTPIEAHPGSSVTVRFGDDPDVEIFRLVASGEHDADDTVSPDSPLGRALIGATAGETVGFAAPSGQLAVTVVAVG